MARFQVLSTNFDFHTPRDCESFAEAIDAAKARGFEAQIYANVGKETPRSVEGRALVASWSPLYGTKIYNRALAGVSS